MNQHTRIRQTSNRNEVGRAADAEAALSPSATEPVPVSAHSGDGQPREELLCATCKGTGGVQEDMGDGQYVGAECPFCRGHGFSEDTEDAVWSAIMEAQGPDSNARDYARAALLALAKVSA